MIKYKKLTLLGEMIDKLLYLSEDLIQKSKVLYLDLVDKYNICKINKKTTQSQT